MEIYYYAMKIMLFASLLSSFVKFEPLQNMALGLSVLYTALVAFLSYVFLIAPGAEQMTPALWQGWQYWLAFNFVITFVYFKLLARFDEGILFWMLLPLAVVILFNEPSLVPVWKQFFQYEVMKLKAG